METLIILTAGSLITGFTAYLNFRDKLKQNKTKREGEFKSNEYIGIFVVALIGVVLSFVGGVISTNNAEQQKEAALSFQRELRDKQNKLEESQSRNLLLSSQIMDTSNRIAKYQDSLVSLNRKLNEANELVQHVQQEVLNNVTGGDNFPMYSLKYLKGNEFTVYVGSKGKYKLSDLSVWFMNVSFLEALIKGNIGKDGIPDYLVSRRYRIQWLNPREFHALPETYVLLDDFTKNVVRKINIVTYAANGSFQQFIYLKKVGNEWYQRLEIYKQIFIGDKMQTKLLHKTDFFK